MSASFLPFITLLLLTLPAGFLLVRRVFNTPAINAPFDLATAFFAGLFLDILLLNGLQWLPFTVSVRTAFLALLSLHLAAAVLLMWDTLKVCRKRSGLPDQGKEQGGLLAVQPHKNNPQAEPRLYPSDKTAARKDQSAIRTFLSSRWPELVIGALALTVLVYATLLASRLPVLAWDAWSGWIAKAKIWADAGLTTAIVPPVEWLERSPSAHVFSSHMWHYPDAIGLLYATFSTLTTTVEQGAAVLWPMASGFLALGIYGFLLHHVRIFSFSSTFLPGALAALAALMLLITPLWLQHMLFPGYADILFACYLWMATAHYVLWLQSSHRGHRRLSLLFLLALPFIKLYGWLTLLIFFFVTRLTQARWRRGFLYAGGICLVVTLIIWGLMPFALETPVGFMVFDRQHLQLPGYGTVKLGFHFAGWAWLEGLFFSRNWLLMWFALPVVMWLVFWQKPVAQGLRLFVVLLLAYLLAVLCLYSLTSFSQYAQTFTSSNRMVLHVYPLYVTALFWVLIAQLKRSPVAQ